MDNLKYKVITKCLTFNHAPYIVETMNGFCMQQTSFPFVCAIVDDASTDGEPEVIEKYLQEHFNLHDSAVARRDETDDYRLVFAQHKTNKNCYFVVLLLKYNHHLKKDKYPYFAEWTDASKYIALCEGDDYWTEPLKLQKQVDFLETHPDYDMVCARFDHLIGETGEIQNFDLYDGIITPEVDGIELNHEHFLCRALPHPCTVMYRSGTLYDNPYWQKLKYKFDVTIYWCFMMTHRVWLMNEKMAMYRKHDDSVTSAAGWMSRKYDAILDLYYNLPDDPVLRRLGASAYRSQTIVYWQNSERFSMKKFMEQMKGYAAFKPTIHNMITLCVRVAQARRAKK